VKGISPFYGRKRGKKLLSNRVAESNFLKSDWVGNGSQGTADDPVKTII